MCVSAAHSFAASSVLSSHRTPLIPVSSAMQFFVALRCVAFHSCRGSGSWRGTSHCIAASQSHEYNRVASAMPVRFSLEPPSPISLHRIRFHSIRSPCRAVERVLVSRDDRQKVLSTRSRARAARRDAAAAALFSSLLFPPALQSSLISFSLLRAAPRSFSAAVTALLIVIVCTAQHGTKRPPR